MRLRGPKIPRSQGTEVRTIEAKVTYQNIGRMAQGKEVGMVTGMIPECSQSVQRWSRVSGVRVEIHGYDSVAECNWSRGLDGMVSQTQSWVRVEDWVGGPRWYW